MPMICSSLKRLLFIICLLRWRTGQTRIEYFSEKKVKPFYFVDCFRL